jgi:hypothetical protein
VLIVFFVALKARHGLTAADGPWRANPCQPGRKGSNLQWLSNLYDLFSHG